MTRNSNSQITPAIPIAIDTPPATPAALHTWIREHTGLAIARSALITGHAAPFDFITHTFFEGRGSLTGPFAVATSNPARP